MPTFATDGKIGVDFTQASTTALFGVGTRTQARDGSTWVYVQADGLVDLYDVVTIDENYQATPATPASAALGDQLGFAQCVIADNSYAWVALNGSPLIVAVSGTSTLSVAIYIGTVSGHLSTTASSGTVAGVALQTASTTSTGTSATAIVSWPKCLAAGV